MAKPHLLQVFTDSDAAFGDAASVVIDEGHHISDAERQAMARTLNTGETIFINDIASANISVMHPQGDITSCRSFCYPWQYSRSGLGFGI